jgi:protein-tyrosine phosphatase
MEAAARGLFPDRKTVLFLCTGNYYRSRFAEIVFNDLARQRGLEWRADSRGLAVGRCSTNVGPISRYAWEGLKARGLEEGADGRFPLQVSDADLGVADLIVAIKEAEHRPLLNLLFPDWVDRVEFWHIDDLDCAEPSEALSVLEEHVGALVERLQSADRDGR